MKTLKCLEWRVLLNFFVVWMGWTCIPIHLVVLLPAQSNSAFMWVYNGTIAFLKRPVHFSLVANPVWRHVTILPVVNFYWVDVFCEFDIWQKDVLINYWFFDIINIFGCKWFYWFSFFWTLLQLAFSKILMVAKLQSQILLFWTFFCNSF